MNGTNGTNGRDSFTQIINSPGLALPAVGQQMTFNCVSSDWASIGQTVYLNSLGYFILEGKPTSTQMTVLYPGAYASINAPPNTAIPDQTGVGPSGVMGPQGDPGVITLNGISPTTTKGDLIVDNGANNPTASDVRFGTGGAGTDGKVLTAKSSTSVGLEWDSVDLSGTNTSITGALPIANGGTGQATALPAFNALSPLTTAGDLLSYSGGNNVRLALGTALQNLRTNAGATAVEWYTATNVVLQKIVAVDTNYNSTSAVIPLDDTIPQNSEGFQFLTVNITPSSNTSRLVIYMHANVGMTTSDEVIMSLFDGGANAIWAGAHRNGNTGQINGIHTFVPGSTSTLTISVRIGSAGGNPVEINGFNGSRYFGGVSGSEMIIIEYGP